MLNVGIVVNDNDKFINNRQQTCANKSNITGSTL